MPSIESIARCVIVRDNAVLLCGAVIEGKAAYWYLPGGHIEVGETARDAVAREMVEEAGIDVSVGQCVLVSENHFSQLKAKTGTLVRRHEYTFVFMAEAPTAQIVSQEPDIRFAWVDLDQIRATELRPASHRAWLAAHTSELKAGQSPAIEFHVEQS